MRTSVTAVVLLFAAVTVVRAAPAPDVDRQAREKLAELGRRLSAELVAAWAKNPSSQNEQSVVFRKKLQLHRVRLTGPAEGKISVRFVGADKWGEHFIPVDLTVHFYDGRWTSVPPPPDPLWDMNYFQRWLAQTIDDIAD